MILVMTRSCLMSAPIPSRARLAVRIAAPILQLQTSPFAKFGLLYAQVCYGQGLRTSAAPTISSYVTPQ